MPLSKEELAKHELGMRTEALEKATKALALGFAFPCSMCVKLWRMMDRGQTQCEAAVNNQRCDGPVAGGSFPKYEGPMGRKGIANHCVRCGKPIDPHNKDRRVRVEDGGEVGICKRHLPMLDTLVAVK